MSRTTHISITRSLVVAGIITAATGTRAVFAARGLRLPAFRGEAADGPGFKPSGRTRRFPWSGAIESSIAYIKSDNGRDTRQP